MMARRTRNSLTRRAARRWHLHLLLSFSSLLPLFPSVEKRGLDRPPSTSPSLTTALRRDDNDDSARCYVRVALSVPLSAYRKRHLDAARLISFSATSRSSSISRRLQGEESRLTPSCRPSCYGHSTVDLWMDGAQFFAHTSGMIRHDIVFILYFLSKRYAGCCGRTGRSVLDLKMPKCVPVYYRYLNVYNIFIEKDLYRDNSMLT